MFSGGDLLKVGIMADTHDNLDATEKAVDFFNEEEVDHVLHAGDLVSPFTANILADLDAEFHYVWGNNEGDKLHCRSNLKEMGADLGGNFTSLDLDETIVALLHGENEEIVEALAESEKFDIVVRGHTHKPEIREDPMVVNPGPASGYLSDQKTVALLDTEDMSGKIVEI